MVTGRWVCACVRGCVGCVGVWGAWGLTDQSTGRPLPGRGAAVAEEAQVAVLLVPTAPWQQRQAGDLGVWL